MPQGDKSKYTDKQKRKAEAIAGSYEERGVPEDEAERRAWATVNKDGGGNKPGGSGRGMRTGNPAAHKGGKKGAKTAASRTAAGVPPRPRRRRRRARSTARTPRRDRTIRLRNSRGPAAA